MSKNRSQKQCGTCSLRFFGHCVVDTYTTRRNQIQNKIVESVEARVRVEVGEWGQSEFAKKLIGKLKNMTEENDVLIREAQVKLDNS